MRCPYCGNDDSKVIDSRTSEDGVRRRRQCLACDARFTTYERVLMPGTVMVVKKDGRREEFSRDKVLRGVRTACEKRPLSAAEIEGLVDTVEREVTGLGRPEVPSQAIGALVMDLLRGLDHIAYIRFASVYREFADIETLKEALEALENAPADLSAQLALFPEDEQVGSRGHLRALRGGRDRASEQSTEEARGPRRRSKGSREAQ